MVLNGYFKVLKPSEADRGQVNMNCIINEEV